MNLPESTAFQIADRLMEANNTPVHSFDSTNGYRPGQLLSHGPKSLICRLIREGAAKQRTAGKPVTLALELTDAQAWNLAQFLKRLSYDTVSSHAASDDDPDEMRAALRHIRQTLAAAGYSPR